MKRRIAWLACAALVLAAPAFAAAPADSLAGLRFGRGDVAFAAVAAGAIAIAANNDLLARARWHDAGGATANSLADVGHSLGDGPTLAAALLAADGLAAVTHHACGAAAIERVAFSAAVAGLATGAIKEAVGRRRPLDSPNDPGRFDPFSGRDAFPSGHATLAFACAAAAGAETHSNLVRAVAFPLAGLVAWSRIHDDKHWASDVLAGAAIGAWTATKADAFARRHFPRGLWAVVLPTRGGAQVRIGTAL